MKLYATTTSERASKGQGGNKEIRIQFQAGAESRQKTYEIIYSMTKDNQVMLEVKASPYDNDYLLRLIDDYPDKVKTKANKQKDEHKCPRGQHCNHYSHIMI
jgi:hypothetical protein